MTTLDFDPALFPRCRQPNCKAAHEVDPDPTLPCVYWAQTGDIPKALLQEYLDDPGYAGKLRDLCPFGQMIYEYRIAQANNGK